MTNSEKGKTADAGYQVGVRKTWPVGLTDAWQWLISPEGMGVWLNADAEAREAMKRHWEAVSADVGRAIERHTAASK